MTVREQKEWLSSQLESISDSPVFEAIELIVFATDLDRSAVLYNQSKEVSVSQQKIIKKCLSKRKKGIPLQYIIGEWEFYSLPFKVGKGVLIPRADSELLVDLALEEIGCDGSLDVFDLCSGSGALGISIAKKCSFANVTLVEKSRKAFRFLIKNIALNSANVKACRADIFKWVPKKKADIVICNPPYIDKEEIKTLQKEVKKEPTAALLGGKDGLKFYRFLAENAALFLKENGKMLVEIGYKQADSVKTLFEASGFCDVEIFKDLAGNDRVVSGVFKPKGSINNGR